MRELIKLTAVLIFLTAIPMQTITAQTAAGPSPAPCSSANHKAFDFWLGEWRVTTPDGKHAGDNTLTKIQNGCVLQENWRSATSPFAGTSFNFYNSQSKQWEQLWLDNQGGFLKLDGNRSGNQIILRSAKQKNVQGVEVVNEITWTKNDDGSVRQLWLVLEPGKEDQVLFDGLYQRPK